MHTFITEFKMRNEAGDDLKWIVQDREEEISESLARRLKGLLPADNIGLPADTSLNADSYLGEAAHYATLNELHGVYRAMFEYCLEYRNALRELVQLEAKLEFSYPNADIFSGENSRIIIIDKKEQV